MKQLVIFVNKFYFNEVFVKSTGNGFTSLDHTTNLYSADNAFAGSNKEDRCVT